jgi:K+-sensing histidine kinase KdpD
MEWRLSAARWSYSATPDPASGRNFAAGPVLGKIFEYGVSDAHASQTQGHRGQGLYVAKTYMAKMGGTVEAVNDIEDGVEFVLTLSLA